jgi:CBS domain-containing protein
VTCFPDTDLSTAKVLMEVKGIKQLPVVKRGAGRRNDGRRKVLGLLHYESIGRCLRCSLLKLVFVFILLDFSCDNDAFFFSA